MSDDNLSLLVRSGLVRQSFVDTATPETLVLARGFADEYKRGAYTKNDQDRIGAVLIQHNILTPEIIENMIIANGRAYKHAPNILGKKSSAALIELVKNNVFCFAAIMPLLKNEKSLLTDTRGISRLAQFMTSGKSNSLNWGIMNCPEYEAIQFDVLAGEYSGKRENRSRNQHYEIAHGLLRNCRAKEHLEVKSKQLEEAGIANNDPRHVADQIDAVWRFYGARSKLLNMMASEPLVDPGTRRDNIQGVNSWQLKRFGGGTPSSERFVDLYARYNKAEMDPFMLAIIAKTVRWYIDSGHAALFTGVRLIPDIKGNAPSNADNIPWIARLIDPKAKILNVSGDKFKNSVMGANRMFFTLSNAKEAMDLDSIPIIGITTWNNTNKLDAKKPYILLPADFDAGDINRSYTRQYEGRDRAASIQGVIEQTLLALRRAEVLEIARAGGAQLQLQNNRRWRVIKRPRQSGIAAGLRSLFQHACG